MPAQTVWIQTITALRASGRRLTPPTATNSSPDMAILNSGTPPLLQVTLTFRPRPSDKRILVGGCTSWSTKEAGKCATNNKFLDSTPEGTLGPSCYNVNQHARQGEIQQKAAPQVPRYAMLLLELTVVITTKQPPSKRTLFFKHNITMVVLHEGAAYHNSQ